MRPLLGLPAALRQPVALYRRPQWLPLRLPPRQQAPVCRRRRLHPPLRQRQQQPQQLPQRRLALPLRPLLQPSQVAAAAT
jgi:hypothetical protein